MTNNKYIARMNSILISKNDFLDSVNSTLNQTIDYFFSNIFEEHPYLQLISWKQYTPFFNDGEPCLFTKNDFSIGIDISLFDHDSLNTLLNKFTWWIEQEDNTILLIISGIEINFENLLQLSNTSEYEKFKKLIDDLSYFENDIFKEFQNLFQEKYGEHSFIKITKNETIIEDYEHD